jgi:hypothetical protein
MAMNHTITIGGLFLTLCVIAGLGISAIGALMLFAGGMSDNPSAGADAGKQGCFTLAIGVALFVGGVWGLLS